jgi:DNA-binding NarL/FixJ family response regulator
MREDPTVSSGHSTRPVRIVIADDDPLFGRMVQAQLSERAEFEVVGLAANWLQAIMLTQELEPDLVLLDVSMPVLDGIDAARIIRQGRRPPSVVLVTGEDDASDARAYKAGAAAYVRKTGDIVPLMDAILAVSQLALPLR